MTTRPATVDQTPESGSRFGALSRSVHALRVDSYRRLWTASLLWNQARWMDQIVLGWVVLELTDSAWHVAMVGVLRWLPVALFGIAGGAVADRLDRKRLLIGMQALGFVVSAAAAALIWLGLFRFEHAIVVALLLGLQWSVDWPVRRALIPDLVGRDLTLNAIVLESISMNVTRIAGPMLAGALVAYVDPGSVFATMALLYGLEILLLAAMRVPRREQLAPTGSVLRYLREGWDELRRNEAIVGVLLITVFMNVFAFPYHQLLPVFARDVLAVDAVGLGLLGAASGVGSLAGAIWLAVRGRGGRAGLIFSIGSFVMCVCLVAFALADDLPTAIIFLLLSGLGSSSFAAYQSTIILGAASDQLRGRAMGALTLAIGTTPLGLFGMGALTTAAGAPFALAVSAALCALLIVATASRLPIFRRAA